MSMHGRYALYLARHKAFVFLAGLRTGAPLWRLLIHDWSKFLPRSEWRPYARWFYGPAAERDGAAFNRAWLAHQHRNAHHWQHWVLRLDDGSTSALQMPDALVKEMVADWMGAGRAITGRWDVHDWYAANKHKMLLHCATEAHVDRILVGLKVPTASSPSPV